MWSPQEKEVQTTALSHPPTADDSDSGSALNAAKNLTMIPAVRQYTDLETCTLIADQVVVVHLVIHLKVMLASTLEK